MRPLAYLVFTLTLSSSVEASTKARPPASNVADLPAEALYKDGDILLGLVTHIRSYSINPVCGEYSPVGALHAIPYAIDYAVGVVNAINELLPNISLGYVILDDCSRDVSAIPRMLQMLPLLPEDVTDQELSVGPNFDVAAVIGPLSSAVSIILASAFSFFQIPLIGATATSNDLSDKVKYSNYFRVIGPDSYQSKAAVSFAAGMNWTYISVAYIKNDFGYNGNAYMIKLAQEAGICIEESYSVSYGDTNEDYYNVVLDMISPKRKAKVVMVFLPPPRIVMLLKAYRRAGGDAGLIFIMPDCMVPHLLYGYHNMIVGSFYMVQRIPDQPELIKHYESIDPWSFPDDPWLPSMWERFFNCSFDGSDLDKQTCKNHSSLKESPEYFFQATTIPYTDAVYAAANALHHLVQEQCPDSLGNRTALRRCVKVPGMLTEYLKNVSYDAPSGMHIEFDSNQDMIRARRIKQLQVSSNGKYHFVETAIYDPFVAKLTIHEDLLQWDPHLKVEYLQESGVPESNCSHVCKYDEIKIMGDVKCCWDCHPCTSTEVVSSNGTKCIECPILEWPDMEKNLCKPISPSYLDWSEPYGIGMMFLASSGFIASLVIFGMMIKHRERRVVKGSTMEISLTIIIGTSLSFLTVPTFIIKPSDSSCLLSRTGFGVSLTFIFGSLCIKLVRIFRIFQASGKFQRNLWCVTTSSTIVLCALVILIQVGITIATSVLLPAKSELRMPVRTEQYVELQCDLNRLGILIPLGYNLLLLLISAVLGLLTRKLPDNFNESWYIFVSVCTTLFIWLAFLSTYFVAFYAYHKAVLLGFALYLNAIISLICLFGPKVYAIYYMKDDEIKITNYDEPKWSAKPKRQVKRLFTPDPNLASSSTGY